MRSHRWFPIRHTAYFVLAQAMGFALTAHAAPQSLNSSVLASMEQVSFKLPDTVIDPPTEILDYPTFDVSWPGEFALKTFKGLYVTAINGGGRATDPIILTNATTAGPWEKFKLPETYPDAPYDRSIQTFNGNYLTTVNGGGLTSGALHTDAVQALGWERFRFLDLSSNNYAPGYYGIGTSNGSVLTAVGAGGKIANAFHTDAQLIQDWEKFQVIKCGDVGSGFEYSIQAADGTYLSAVQSSGQSQGDVGRDYWASPASHFRLLQQGDGTHALQTSNGSTFVTALNGGGLVQKYLKCDPGFPGACIDGISTIFHTDATQIQAWEKFRLIDQGNCTYAIQTSSGFNVGIYKDSGGRTLLTTRRDGVSTANELFQLIVHGLASPVIIQ